MVIGHGHSRWEGVIGVSPLPGRLKDYYQAILEESASKSLLFQHLFIRKLSKNHSSRKKSEFVNYLENDEKDKNCISIALITMKKVFASFRSYILILALR